ncbi:lipopolysaccharide biosynthesis protein [Nocardioides taihuensis]|uniref:Lipopolysaccharide biosynthesis protein n=1 Tax=Nocardioides taihuensis TaxID=1835606 RepID=A0ABW0BN44_9ACTN
MTTVSRDPVPPVPPGGAPERSANDRELRRLARGSTLNLAGSFVTVVLNIVLPVIITRNYVQGEAGLFFQGAALFTILINVGTVGADTGVLRFLPRAVALDRRADLRRSLVIALAPAVVFSLLVGGLVLLLAGTLADLLTDTAAASDQFAGVLRVLALFLPVAVVYVVLIASSRGLGSVRPLVFVEKIGRNSAETVSAGTAATLGAPIILITVAWVAPYLAALLVIALWVAGRLRRMAALAADGAAPRPWREMTGEFWRFSAPRAVSRIFTIALQRFDVLLVAALRGPADAAVYAVATRFLVLGLMFVQAIQQVMAPRIASSLAVDDVGVAKTLYRTTTTWLTLVSWPIYLVVMLFAPLLLSIFGSSYERGSLAVVVLCAAMLVATVCGPVDSMLLMAGRSVQSLVNTGLALALNVSLDLVLVPWLGVSGAALGWAAAILLNNLLALWQVHRATGLHPFGPGTRSAMLICVVSWFLVVGAVRLVTGPTLVGLLVGGAAGAACFAVLAGRRRGVLELAALASVAEPLTRRLRRAR